MNDRQRQFFTNCKRLSKPEQDKEFQKIKAEYGKALAEADEKVTHAEEAYSLLDRHLRKLDNELHKFKLELEADNRGITEMLEKRSLELDAQPKEQSKENRHPKKNTATGSRKGANQTISHASASLASAALTAGALKKQRKSNAGSGAGGSGLGGLGFSMSPYVDMGAAGAAGGSGSMGGPGGSTPRMYTFNYLNPSSPMAGSP